MKTILALVITLLFSTCSAQITFQKTYGSTESDWGFSIQPTMDNGYILTGITNSFGAGNYDIYLIKTNINGDTLWTKTYGGTGDDRSYCVQQTTDTGYIITGYTSSFGVGGEDIYLIKTNSNGDTLWTRTFGGTLDDWGSSVQQTTDGGYIILGSTESFGAGNFDIYAIKTDSVGNTLWAKIYGGFNWDYGAWVQQTNDSGFVLAGSTNSFGAGYYDVYLIKINNTGDTLWTKTYGEANDENSSYVQQTADGGYIITGRKGLFQTATYDVFLIRTDVNGDTIWTKSYGGAGYDISSSVQQTFDGGFIITGETTSFGAGNYDVYLIKTDINGNSLWTKTFGGTGYDRGFSVQETSDSGYIVCGSTESFGAGKLDVYLIKTDVNGIAAPVGINSFQHTRLRVEVYPNPTETEINIDLQTQSTNIHDIDIYSALGQKIKTINTNKNKITIDISDLKDGVYFIVITDRHSRQLTKKIMKNAP